MKSLYRLFIVLALALATAGVLAAPASAATPKCPTGWGSTPKSISASDHAALTKITTGRQRCFDRVVFQVLGASHGGWSVRYVPVVRAEGSGDPLDVAGRARLEVVLDHPAHDGSGRPTLPVAVGAQAADVHGYTVLRSVVYGGSSEGRTTIGVGTRARLPFRVTVLPGPGDSSRIVLDVARRW